MTALLAALGSGEPDTDRAPGPDSPIDPELLVDPELLDRVCARAQPPGVSLVAYPRTGERCPTRRPRRRCTTLLGYMANRTHVVLVAGLDDPETRTAVMRAADARVLLYEPTLASIGAAVHCMALLGPECPALLVQSHPRMRRSALSPAQVQYALADRRPDATIPFEPALHAAATGEGPQRRPGRAYLEALREVMERAVEVPAPASA